MRVLANNLDDLEKANIPALYKKIKEVCKSFNDMESDPDYYIGNNFNIDFGGSIMLVEKPEDLYEIKTTTASSGSSYLSIAETAACFDICEYIDNEKYVYLLLCTHNGGGVTYIIPTSISNQFPTVEQSIFMTNVDYNDPAGEDNVDYP
jgi:hypothetical protein